MLDLLAHPAAQPLAVLLGVLVAVVAIAAQRRTSAKRATLDFISRHEVHTGSHWPTVVAQATEAIDNKTIWHTLLSTPRAQLTPAQVAQKVSLITWLNHYELVATAIHRGALDRQFYEFWFGDGYKDYWSRSQACIEFVRRSKPSAFLEFERFAASIK